MTAVEAGVRERMARLESGVQHIQVDIGEIKVDVRSVRDKLDGMNATLSARVDNLGAMLDARMERSSTVTDGRIDGLRTEVYAVKDSIASAKVWALILNGTMAATLLGTMARGFGWV